MHDICGAKFTRRNGTAIMSFATIFSGANAGVVAFGDDIRHAVVDDDLDFDIRVVCARTPIAGWKPLKLPPRRPARLLKVPKPRQRHGI